MILWDRSYEEVFSEVINEKNREKLDEKLALDKVQKKFFFIKNLFI